MNGQKNRKRIGKMDDSLRFEYYYGIEAEQFSFYRVPRMLIKDERFKVLSSDAKLLYGLMLDRMALSIKNGWFDEENRAYIHYTIDNIMEDFNCAKATATKILAELDGKKGIGLIEKKRQGLGKPDIIYVKNFVVTESIKEVDEKAEDLSDVGASVEILKSVDEDVEDSESELPEAQNLGIKKSNYQTSRGSESELPEVQNLGNRKFDSENTGSSESELPEVQNLGIKKFDNPISRSSKIEPQEVQKSNSKYNNNSYTDMSYINQSYQSDNLEKSDGFDETVKLMSLVKENIEYDSIMQNTQWKDWELYEELYEIICEIVCVKRKIVRIGGEDYPYELVKSKFMKLNSSHLLYVIECMQNTTSRITNIKSYMVTALYNAPNTMNHYYQQAVQHDMYGGGWQEKEIV